MSINKIIIYICIFLLGTTLISIFLLYIFDKISAFKNKNFHNSRSINENINELLLNYTLNLFNKKSYIYIYITYIFYIYTLIFIDLFLLIDFFSISQYKSYPIILNSIYLLLVPFFFFYLLVIFLENANFHAQKKFKNIGGLKNIEHLSLAQLTNLDVKEVIILTQNINIIDENILKQVHLQFTKLAHLHIFLTIHKKILNSIKILFYVTLILIMLRTVLLTILIKLF